MMHCSITAHGAGVLSFRTGERGKNVAGARATSLSDFHFRRRRLGGRREHDGRFVYVFGTYTAGIIVADIVVG